MTFCRPPGSVDILFRPNGGGSKDKSSVWPLAFPHCALGVQSASLLRRPKVSHCSNDSFTLSTQQLSHTVSYFQPPSRRLQVWLCSTSKTAAECPLADHSVSVRTLRRPNRHIRHCVQIGFARTCPSCPNLFYLLTILCSPACCRRPCFVGRCFVLPRGFIHPVHLHFVLGATENLEAIFLQLGSGN